MGWLRTEFEGQMKSLVNEMFVPNKRSITVQEKVSPEPKKIPENTGSKSGRVGRFDR